MVIKVVALLTEVSVSQLLCVLYSGSGAVSSPSLPPGEALCRGCYGTACRLRWGYLSANWGSCLTVEELLPSLSHKPPRVNESWPRHALATAVRVYARLAGSLWFWLAGVAMVHDSSPSVLRWWWCLTLPMGTGAVAMPVMW